jgi:ATP-dependent Lon protease
MTSTSPAPARKLPLLPVKNTVLFPHTLLPIAVGRPASVAAVEAAVAAEEKEILVVAQRDPSVDEPSRSDIFDLGTRGVVHKRARLSEGIVQILVQGVERVRIGGFVQGKPYVEAAFTSAPVAGEGSTETEALKQEILGLARKIISLIRPEADVDLSQLVNLEQGPLHLVYFLASVLGLEFGKDQRLLESGTLLGTMRMMHEYLRHEVRVLELRREITSKTTDRLEKEQREFLLRQQLRAIQEELGEAEGGEGEVEELRERVKEAGLPEPVLKEARKELARLTRVPSASPEHGVIRTYLETILDLPWSRRSEDVVDLARAREVLDEDHHDLEEVKERILEHLAVLRLNPAARPPILCFVGPPGVGKTSLGQSIARALNRRFERTSLGGLHDEAELRGHRRTYVGAMPGRILTAVRRAGVNNPVLMLDEIDKLGRDFRGDPAAAMLEILDPEQNHAFRDNYLDLPFDLSKVFFITTANTLETIPGPLLDRMEVIRLSGYTEEEKIAIAGRYLAPRQLSQAGLGAGQVSIPEEALRRIIRKYSREAGLRQLERSIGKLARKVAFRIARGEGDGRAVVVIRPEELAELLGPEPFHVEEARRRLPPGVAAGLAWTEAGGDVLYIETTLLPGDKGLTLTGQLGEVMQESARAAQSYLWSHAESFGIGAAPFKDRGVHVHVPSGAIPKDGPSAGIAIATALASLYTGRPVRSDTAMTGEITLAGLVLPIGGVKEKVLAAHRAEMRRVILPRQNASNVREIPEKVRESLEVVLVETVEEALVAAIPGLPAPVGT